MRKSSGNLRILVSSVILALLWFSGALLHAGFSTASANTATVTPEPCHNEQTVTPCTPIPLCPYCVYVHDWVFDPGAIPATPQNNYEVDIHNSMPFPATILDSNGKVIATIQPGGTLILHFGPGTFRLILAQSGSMLLITGIPG